MSVIAVRDLLIVGCEEKKMVPCYRQSIHNLRYQFKTFPEGPITLRRKRNFYRPQTKSLGHGNVFTGVYLSMGGGASQHASLVTSPGRGSVYIGGGGIFIQGVSIQGSALGGGVCIQKRGLHGSKGSLHSGVKARPPALPG